MQLMKIATELAVAVALLPATVAAGATSSSGLDGVYRVAWTEKELAAAGTNQPYAHRNHGVLTWTLRGGSFRLRFPAPPLCHGTYAVSGASISIREGPGCHGVVKARWSLRNDQLRLRVTRATDPGDKVLFGGKPWKKIG
jgi:hypothetical protein